MKSLARYVPRVSATWAETGEGRWREVDGTLCYIDISGFTALSEKLARRGRIGAEELTGVLNHVFGEMLGISYSRGGDLLKFGGDALLLLFLGDDHPVQGCSAAVEMRAALRKASDYRTSAGKLNLKMSIGLHSGPVHLFRVGESHQELILTGPGASMTTEMEETAVAGEILISGSTRDALPRGSATKSKGEGWLLKWRKPRLDPIGRGETMAADEADPSTVPTVLRDFLQYGKAEPEHRIATVGFVRFQGVDRLMADEGPDAVADALHGLVSIIQREADAEQVTFLATDIDENGGKVILVTGVPGAQEDDEGRVLRAVRRVMDSAGVLTLQIGVNRGHVFAGEIGAPYRATYTIMGDSVNLAARLMASAGTGEIYASPDVLDRSLSIFATDPVEPFYVKGKEEPVQAYLVGSLTGTRRADRGGDLPYTGRSDELSRIGDAVVRLEAGSGGVVTIEGETGIGKSRLVHEALQLCNGPKHVRIHSEPYGTAMPYRALRDPVRAVLGIERGTPQDMSRQLLAAVKALGGEFEDLAPLLGSVAGVEVPATDAADAIEPRFRQDRTADLVVSLFEQQVPGQILFDVEDAHWMDEASAHVMDRMAAATSEHDWLLLVTRRDEEGGFAPEGEVVTLGPLADEDVRKLIVGATKATPLRPQDVAEIVRRVNGIPLFVEEILRVVRQSGDVRRLPDSLDAVVSSQIDALAPLSRRLLRYASVLGQTFSTDLLRELIKDEGVELDDATRKELSGFIDPAGEGYMAFRHSLVRDAAYEGLSFERRRSLHLRAGEAVERRAGDNVDGVANILALHFFRAGDHERSWRYSVVAGDRARGEYANVEAIEQYERALDSGRRLDEVTGEDLAAVWTDLGTVRELAGLFDGALDAFGRAARLLSSRPVAVAGIKDKRAHARDLAGQYSLALRELTSGYRLIEDISSTEAAEVRARLLASSATVRVAQQKNLKRAIDQALQAIGEAERAGALAAMARAYSSLDTAYRWVGESDKAVHGADALAIYEQLGDLGGQGVVAGNLGAEAYFDGRWEDAVDLYRRSRDAFLKSGNAVQAALAEAAEGEVLVNQGHADEARPLLEDSLRTLRAAGFADGAAFAQVQLARALGAQGSLEEAVELLEEARAHYLELGETPFAVDAGVQLAQCRLHTDEPERALATVREAEDMGGGQASVYAAALPRVKAHALAELGRLDEALSVAGAGLEEARRHGLPYEVAMITLSLAEFTRRSGGDFDRSDVDEALRVLEGLGVDRAPEAFAALS